MALVAHHLLQFRPFQDRSRLPPAVDRPLRFGEPVLRAARLALVVVDRPRDQVVRWGFYHARDRADALEERADIDGGEVVPVESLASG